MNTYQTVAKVGDIPDGEGRTVTVNGQLIAVFYVEGNYRAISDACPHMGASLATGHVEDGVVTCPWHAWRFCIHEGTWLDNPEANLKIDSYPVRVQDDEIQVQVPPPSASA